MNNYQIIVEKRATKYIDKLPPQTRERIISKMFTVLGDNPFPRKDNPKALKDSNILRLRVGDYRIHYRIKSTTVIVMTILHRKDAYKNL